MAINHLEDQAIQFALNQDWPHAVDINLEILDENPYHIPTLNRLAKAYSQMGSHDKSIVVYQQVLQIDPYNSIAKNNLASLKASTPPSNGHSPQSINTDFIDEPGITKTVPLIRLGDSQLISSLQPGQVVHLVCNSHLVCVTTHDNEHVGAVTDDIAFYLRSCLQEGNTYMAVIKHSTPTSVNLFVREVSRTGKYKHIPTFSNC